MQLLWRWLANWITPITWTWCLRNPGCGLPLKCWLALPEWRWAWTWTCGNEWTWNWTRTWTWIWTWTWTFLATNVEMKTKELSHEREARQGTALKRLNLNEWRWTKTKACWGSTIDLTRCLFGHCPNRPRVKFNGASLTYPHVPVSTFRSLFSAAASPLAHHGAGHGAHHHRHDGAHLLLLLRAPNHSILPPPHPHGTARFLFRLTDIISRCARSNLLRRLRPFFCPQSV